MATAILPCFRPRHFAIDIGHLALALRALRFKKFTSEIRKTAKAASGACLTGPRRTTAGLKYSNRPIRTKEIHRKTRISENIYTPITHSIDRRAQRPTCLRRRSVQGLHTNQEAVVAARIDSVIKEAYTADIAVVNQDTRRVPCLHSIWTTMANAQSASSPSAFRSSFREKNRMLSRNAAMLCMRSVWVSSSLRFASHADACISKLKPIHKSSFTGLLLCGVRSATNSEPSGWHSSKVEPRCLRSV